MNRRLRWREYLSRRSKDFTRKNWSGIWKFSEFFFGYLKLIFCFQWQGAKARQSNNITYLLETHDDWATAPPKFKIYLWRNSCANSKKFKRTTEW